MSPMKRILGAIAVCALVAAISAQATEIIKPQIGEPLRDAAVTRAPDGTYYLTGTRAKIKYLSMDKEQPSVGPDGKPDFMSNNGVRLWSSKDLSAWKDEGLVFDLMSRRQWQNHLNHFYAMPNRPLGSQPVRGIVAPRLHFIGNNCLITVSNVGYDVRWLRAEKPQGPYVDGRVTGIHSAVDPLLQSDGPGHGMLFTDADGSTWLVRGPGYLAKVQPDLKNTMAEPGTFLLAKVAGYPNAEWCAKQFDPRAAAIALRDGQYILTWVASTDEAGFKRDDSFYAVADKLMGPYSEPHLLLPGSGPVVLFDAADKGLMASCSAGDQPILVPLTLAGKQLTVAALFEPAVTAAAKPGKPGAPKMFDYAHSTPSGNYSVRAGEEVTYQVQRVFDAKKPGARTDTLKGRSYPVPVFDVPVADAAICRGGDGSYYLTGTVASKKSDASVQADFENNDGVYLWRSADMNTWTPLGKVWDIAKDAARSPKSTWQLDYRIPGDQPLRDDFCRGITSPEIHFADNTYWIPYSMNGRGSGLLKSASGKAEGPYEDMGRITAMGEAPSLFVDLDGTKHWLWGKGLQIAALTGDCAALQGSVADMFLSFVPYKGRDFQNTVNIWDLTGPHLFAWFDPVTKKTQYGITFSAVTQLQDRANRDSVIVVGEQIAGPYQAQTRMIPQGGQTSVFADADGVLYASFCGADPLATFRDRPGIVPMEIYRKFGQGRCWPRMVEGDCYTTRGPWAETLPPKGLEKIGARDTHVFHAPDGWFYFSHSNPIPASAPWEGVPYVRAKDLLGPYEPIKPLYTMEEMRADPNWPEIKDDKDKTWNAGKGAWEPALSYGQGTYWLACWFGGHGWGKDVCWKKSIGALLKSSSGKPEGPYVFHSEWPHDWQGLQWHDGAAYGMAPGRIWRLTADLKGIDKEWADRDGKKFPNGLMTFSIMDNGMLMTQDCNSDVWKIDGRYVHAGLTAVHSYSLILSWADDIRGPYRYLGIVPSAGNSQVHKNLDGKWYTMPQQGHFGSNFLGIFRNTDKYTLTAPSPTEVKFLWDGPTPSVWYACDVDHLKDSVYRK